MKKKTIKQPSQKEIQELVATLNAAGVGVITGDKIPKKIK